MDLGFWNKSVNDGLERSSLLGSSRPGGPCPFKATAWATFDQPKACNRDGGVTLTPWADKAGTPAPPVNAVHRFAQLRG
jgi:hypothetical protein